MRAVVQQSGYGVIMKKALELIRGLHSDEDGASLVEYTMLLAIIVLAVMGQQHVERLLHSAERGPDPVTGKRSWRGRFTDARCP
jgi:Flp pilus assembly pilin Flp